MSVGDTLTDIATRLAALYKEIATTTVRFEELQRATDKTLTRFEAALEQLLTKVELLHDAHIRERADLRAEIRLLEGRLTALSEQALHAVAKDAARELLRDSIDSDPDVSALKRPRIAGRTAKRRGA